MKNLYAFTSLETVYPPYISVNADESVVEVTVRSQALDGKCGDTATIRLTWAQAAQLAEALNG